MTFRDLRILVNTSVHVHDLFVKLVNVVWTDSEIVRRTAKRMKRPESLLLDSARDIPGFAQALTPRASELDSTRFRQYRDGLLNQIRDLEGSPDDRLDHVVASAVVLLQNLDPVIGALLQTGEDRTYPVTPDPTGYTVALRPTAYYATLPTKARKVRLWEREAGSLRTVLDEYLHSVYVVPPLHGDEKISWRVRRLPDIVESRLGDSNHAVLLVSVPHALDNLEYSLSSDDDKLFQVTGLTAAAEPLIVEQLRTVLSERLKERPWSVIVLPEYCATPAVRQCVAEILQRHPDRAALVVGGSSRIVDDGGRARNRCRCLDATGALGDHLPTHDKITRFTYRGAIEDIDVEDCTVTFWDSETLGRSTVLICRDILERAPDFFLRHHYFDHLFVPAMSPSLEDFESYGVDLGALLGAGIYIANSPVLAETDERDAALGYRPVHGGEKRAVRRCAGGHHVCAHGFTFSDGWLY